MGGKAIKDSVRMDLADYGLLAITMKSCFEKFRQKYNLEIKYEIVKAYKEKLDFGDMDIVVSSYSENFKELVHLWMIESFSSHENFEYVQNGPVISYSILKRQVDLIFQAPEDYEFACNYFSYNDINNLIGRITDKMGFKFGHDGLWYTYRDGDTVIKKICLTKDFQKALEAFDFDYEAFKNGFNNLDEIFKYVSENKFFNKNLYQLENRNHTARMRDRKRKTYMLFLEYCGNNKFENEYDFNKDPHFFIDMMFEKFPMFLADFVLATQDAELRRASKQQLTNQAIKDHTGLDGIELGKYIQATKSKFMDINQWNFIVITLPIEYIFSIMDFNYKEAKNGSI